MATQVVMPKLSPTMEEGQLSRWLKQEGDRVTVGEPLAEIDTDKATMEAQALAEGVLRKIVVAAGTTVPLGQVIAIIAAPDEDISALLSQVESGKASAANKQAIDRNVESGQDGAQAELAQVVPEGARTQATIQGAPLEGDTGGSRAKGSDETKRSDETSAASPSTQAQSQSTRQPTAQQQAPQAPPSGGDARESGNGQRGGGRLIVSPIAARMAADANINLRTLAGSGPGGRIVKRDIEAAIKSGGESQASAQQSQSQPQLRAVE
jgi:pyruvate dehydrogenase E2 component (dihydrolipoamide acetyltransferase)